jgi:cytochrome c oxidase subunit 4
MNDRSPERETIGWLVPRYAGVWLALMALLGATLASAYVPLDGYGAVVHLGVAGLQLLLIWVMFMNLSSSSHQIRVCATAGLFWLLFLFSLTFADYLTRSWSGALEMLRPL